MALTEFQRRVCRLIAGNRIRGGESYVAGGAALTTLTAGQLQGTKYYRWTLQNEPEWLSDR